MENKLGQEPMFANNNTNGCSKRFYAACAAMQGLLANYNSQWRDENTGKITNELIPEYVARAAYKFADELLAQENK